MLLFVAVAHLPIGYYTFLRIAVTVTAVILLAHFYQRESLSVRTVVFGAITILFNPVLPIYLHSKSVWVPIDLATGLAFVVSAILHNKSIRKRREL